MKILFLTSWYPTEQRPHFGLFVREHAHAIRSVGHDVRIITVQLSRSKKIFKLSDEVLQDKSGLNIHLISIASRFHDFVHYFYPLHKHFYQKKTEQLLMSGWKPDIIHTNVVYPAGVAGRAIAKKYGIPYIVTEHWSRVGEMLKVPIIGGIIRKTFDDATKITVVSKFLKQSLTQMIPFLYEEKITITGNVVNSSHFRFTDETNIEKSDKIHFCSVATWNSKKKPDKLPELFIEALSEIQKRHKLSIKLTMIGGGNQVSILKQLCLSFGIEAEFTGFIDKKEIVRILQKTDFLLHASRIETFSIVVAEALSCGVPVVCSNVGALPELIKSSNGVLCENTTSSWIEAILSAISIKFDRATIASSFQNKFSEEQIGKLFTEVYQEVIQKQGYRKI